MADVYMRIMMSAVGSSQILSTVSAIGKALGSGGLGNALGNLSFGFRNLKTEGTIGMDAITQGGQQLIGSLLKIGATVAFVGGVAAIALGVTATRAAADYQSAMVQLQNTTNSSDADMAQYTATIRQLSDTTGKAQTDLAKGMYQIISANFAGSDATRILTTATQAAIIANADQTQVTTGLVVTLNAFGLKASQVDVISNQMFKTLSLGRGQMSDLAGALQTGGALVAHYGVSVTDMDATLATLSTGGMKTFGTSMTGLTQLLNVMDGKTDMMAKRIQKLGIPFDEAKFKTMSFQQQVAYLNHALENNKGQTVAILGSKQAATALGILGTQSALLAANTKKLADSHELAKQKQEAWAKVQGTFSQQMNVFGANVQNILIDLGTQLLPILTQVAQNIMPVVMAVGNWLVKSGVLKAMLLGVVGTISNLVSWGGAVITFFKNNQWATDALIAILISAAGIILGILIPAFVAWAAAMLPVMIETLATAAPFILIGLIVAAVIFGIIMAVQHWGQIAHWLQQVWGAIAGFFVGLWNGIMGIFGGIGNWFHQKWTQAYNAVTGAFGAIGGWFQAQYNNITGIFGNIGGFFHDKFVAVVADIKGVFGGIGQIFTGIWNGIVSGIKGIINGFISMINGIINGINGISGKIGIPAIPDIPLLARGGIVPPGGVAIVGESGPEIVAGGTGGLSVLGARQSAGILSPRQGAYGGAGGGNVTNHYWNINLSTMARSQSEVSTLVDLFEAELANRFRVQTPGYGSSNVF